ncbi:hypothetical protein AYI70_g12146 [Smittium culicis]|uniref:Uncharacterized protein n=1 Tax=Smittium culicis TaxID=133412 RepID=A0A1R1WYQ4_9FUNG|nr:hypothetical protein AYI70_g12146 [Smittium culicis]
MSLNKKDLNWLIKNGTNNCGQFFGKCKTIWKDHSDTIFTIKVRNSPKNFSVNLILKNKWFNKEYSETEKISNDLFADGHSPSNQLKNKIIKNKIDIENRKELMVAPKWNKIGRTANTYKFLYCMRIDNIDLEPKITKSRTKECLANHKNANIVKRVKKQFHISILAAGE